MPMTNSVYVHNMQKWNMTLEYTICCIITSNISLKQKKNNKQIYLLLLLEISIFGGIYGNFLEPHKNYNE